MKIGRNKKTPNQRAYWEFIERVAERVVERERLAKLTEERELEERLTNRGF